MNAAMSSRALPFGLSMLFLALVQVAQSTALGGTLGTMAWDTPWLYPIKIGAVALTLWWLRKHYHELQQTCLGAGSALSSLLLGLGVFFIWIHLGSGWVTLGTPNGYAPLDAAGEVDWVLAALRLAGAVLVVPLMEELFWRSFFMRWLQRQDFMALPPGRVKTWAWVGSSIAFGFAHQFWLAGVIAGLAYGWLYMRSGNLWAPIVAHAVTNFALGAWVVLTASWSFW